MRARRGARRRSGPLIELAPLIDVTFILLLFFLLTTTFDPDQGLSLQRAPAESASATPEEGVRVALTGSGRLLLAGRPVTPAALESRFRALAAQGRSPVVVVPDERAPSGRLVLVLDLARKHGLQAVTIATRPSSLGAAR